MADMGDGGGGHDKKGKKKKGSPRVDMTPMVDLGFLLITFFMLTTTLSKPQSMELNMPDKTDKSEQQPTKASHSLTVILGKDDQVFYFVGTPKDAKEGDLLQKTDFSSAGIRKVILDKTKEIGGDEKGIPMIVVVIKAMDDSKYKNMVDILDEMHITNSKRYAIVDLLPEEIELTKKFDI